MKNISDYNHSWRGLKAKQFLEKNISKIILAVYFILLFPQVFFPLNSGHAWRQADTWAISKNFAFESGNFFYPRVDVRKGTSGIDASEMPWYQYTIAGFMRLFQTSSPFFGKMISILAGLGIVWLFSLWIHLELKILRPLALIAAAGVPILFNYSQKFMPEVFSLFFSILGSYYVFKDYKEPKIKYIAAACFFLMIGITARPMQIFWGLAFIYVLFQSGWKKKAAVIRYVVAGLVTLTPFLFWYFYWSPHLRSYGLDYFNAINDDYGFAKFFDISLYTQGTSILLNDFIGYASLPLMITGMLVYKKHYLKKNHFVLFLGMVGAFTLLGMIFLTGKHILVHNYYVISMFPFFVIFSTLGLQAFFRKYPNWATGYGVLLLLIPFLSLIHTYRSSATYQALLPIKEKLQSISHSQLNKKVVVEENGSYAWLLYGLDARGWVVEKKLMQDKEYTRELVSMGAGFFVCKEQEKYRMFTAQEWVKKLEKKDISEIGK